MPCGWSNIMPSGSAKSNLLQPLWPQSDNKQVLLKQWIQAIYLNCLNNGHRRDKVVSEGRTVLNQQVYAPL